MRVELAWRQNEFLHISNKWFGCIYDLGDEKELFLPLFRLATATKKSTQLGLSIAQLIKILRENTS